MKKVLVFAALVLAFASCNSVAQYKPAIDELAGKWDSATSAVTDFANSVKSEQSNWQTAMTGMTIAPEAMAKWDDAKKTAYNEIQTGAQGATAGLSGIASELDGFVTSWTEKAKGLQTLKDGLAAGKIEGDVKSQIADLTAAATDATSKLDGWKKKFEEVKGMASAVAQKFAAFNGPAAPAAGTPATK